MFSLVSRCPSGTDHKLTHECEHDDFEPTTVRQLTESLPLARDGILFKNKACIQCHGLLPHVGTTQMNLVYDCKDRLVVSATSNIELETVKTLCTYTSSFIHLLRINMGACHVNTCLNSSKDYLTESCARYSSNIVIRDGTKAVAKNPFCAECAFDDNLLNTSMCINFAFRGNGGSTIAGTPLYKLFTPNWEHDTRKMSDQQFVLRIALTVSSAIHDVSVMTDFMTAIIRLRILNLSIMKYVNTTFDSSGVIVQPCKDCGLNEQEDISLTASDNDRAFYTVQAEARIDIHEDRNPYESVEGILRRFTVDGVLSDENVRYHIINASFSKLHKGATPHCEMDLTQFTENDYVITSRQDGVVYITLIGIGKQYRTDSDMITLTYYSNHSDASELMYVRASLLICDVVEYQWFSFVTTVFIFLSLGGLIFIVLTYFKFEKIRNVPGKNLVNMCLAMGVSLMWLLLFKRNDNAVLCTVSAVVAHYFWLAAFFWMSVNGFDTWRTFRPDALMVDQASLGALYSAYRAFAWGVPSIITTASVVVTYAFPQLQFGYGNKEMCWLNNPIQVVATFLIPIGFICLGNLLFFSDTVTNICRVRKMSKAASESHKTAMSFLPYVKVPVVLGTSWLLAFMSSVFSFRLLSIVSDMINSLQGVMLFLVFISNRRIRGLYGWVKDGEGRVSSSTMNSTAHSRK